MHSKSNRMSNIVNVALYIKWPKARINRQIEQHDINES